MVAATSVDSFLEGFPHPVLTKIQGTPDYASLKVINDEMTENGASVHSNLGGGQLGHASLTLTPAIMGTLTTTAFLPPPNPGPTLDMVPLT